MIPTIFDASLEAYISSAMAIPVYASVLPQSFSNYPGCVYTLVYQTPKYTMGSAAYLVEAEYQFDIYGPDALEVERMNELLRISLESYRGMMGSTYVSGSRIVDTHQLDEESIDGSDSWLYRLSSEYTIIYQETVPIFS